MNREKRRIKRLERKTRQGSTTVISSGGAASSGGVTEFLELNDTPDTYAGQSGLVVKVKVDESGLEFGTGGGSGTPGGSDTQVQFNDGGAFGGDAGLTYNKTTNVLTAGDVQVTDDAYGAGWNGSLEVPTKNALYDKIETLSGLTSDESDQLELAYTRSLNQLVW
jgi:hypothetical protein